MSASAGSRVMPRPTARPVLQCWSWRARPARGRRGSVHGRRTGPPRTRAGAWRSPRSRELAGSSTRAGSLLFDPPATHERRIGVVLGRAVAHEIGHYLLQTNTHAVGWADAGAHPRGRVRRSAAWDLPPRQGGGGASRRNAAAGRHLAPPRRRSPTSRRRNVQTTVPGRMVPSFGTTMMPLRM